MTSAKRRSRQNASTRRRDVRSRWKLALAALLLTAIGLAPVASSGQPYSEPPAVELSVGEADSILATIERLEVDLWECRRLAAADSSYYADKLELQERAYERMLDAYKDERPNWFERVLKQPVVWLAIGMWIGVQAP